MTNEEQELLIAYLVDAGEIDPDGDLKDQFMDWSCARAWCPERPTTGHPRRSPGAEA